MPINSKGKDCWKDLYDEYQSGNLHIGKSKKTVKSKEQFKAIGKSVCDEYSQHGGGIKLEILSKLYEEQ